MVVWLASYPRSGNTFFRILLHHLYGVKTYSVYDDRLFGELGASDEIGHESLPAPIAELDAEPAIHFVKTHDLPTDGKPAVYLARDGRDAVVSFARYIRSFTHPRLSNRKRLGLFFRERVLRQDLFIRTLRELIESPSLYGGWSENVFGWIRRPSGPVTVVRYENLIADPVGILAGAVAALNLDIRPTSDKVPSFDDLHAKWPAFFRKGKVGTWRDEMPELLHELFWEKHGEAMRELGYQP